jgi:DNA-binding CsgD family transcriptional regulator
LPIDLTYDDKGLHCVQCGATRKFKHLRLAHREDCITLKGFKGLSEREKQIAVLISQGLHLKEIATNLGIATKTVDAHKYNIYNKLNVHHVALLTRIVVEHERSTASPEVQTPCYCCREGGCTNGCRCQLEAPQ